MFVDMTADIAHTLHPHRQLLVAFSGGLDSTVLLHQLVLLREQDPSLTLRAVHVHHGLSAPRRRLGGALSADLPAVAGAAGGVSRDVSPGGLGVEAQLVRRAQAFQDTLNAGEVL